MPYVRWVGKPPRKKKGGGINSTDMTMHQPCPRIIAFKGERYVPALGQQRDVPAGGVVEFKSLGGFDVVVGFGTLG